MLRHSLTKTFVPGYCTVWCDLLDYDAQRDISSAKLQERFGEWQEALERNGLKVNADKTETMVCARTAESLQITDKNGKALKQVENFKYLGSVIHAQGGNEEDITARIAAAWKKWKELSGVLCDRRMTVAVKGKVYYIQNNGKASN